MAGARPTCSQTARAWGAATPYADRAVPWYEPAAATAMRKCEERLRDLHPHAMARYDRLRADGMGPADAMREAAPLFTRPPRVHDAPFTPRPPLDAETPVRVTVEHGPGRAGFDAHAAAQAQERRGRQIIDALQEQARAYGRDLLGEAEQRSILETVTNLPPDRHRPHRAARSGHRAGRHRAEPCGRRRTGPGGGPGRRNRPHATTSTRMSATRT